MEELWLLLHPLWAGHFPSHSAEQPAENSGAYIGSKKQDAGSKVTQALVVKQDLYQVCGTPPTGEVRARAGSPQSLAWSTQPLFSNPSNGKDGPFTFSYHAGLLLRVLQTFIVVSNHGL